MQIVSDFNLKVDELTRSGYFVRIEQYITKGFIIFRKKPELFLLYTAFILLVMPLGGSLVSFPLTAGYFIAAHRLENGKSMRFENFFEGFKFIIPLTLLMLVEGAIVFLGFLLLIIPGIYLFTAYYFAPFFVIFGKLNFWESMEMSRKLIHKEWFGIFGLVIILGLINILGALALGVGVLFTFPITFCALYAAFNNIIGMEGSYYFA